MNKTILIAGLMAVITAGAAAAQAPANPPPAGQAPGPGAHRFHGGPGGMGGMGGRRFMRQPPTAEQVQQRNAALFARADTNKDGRLTFEEFRAEQERRRLERQRQMFQRFSGGQDSVTLDQMNARSLERLNERQDRRGRGGPRRGPAGQTPPAPPAAR